MPIVPGTDHEPLNVSNIINRVFTSVLNAINVNIVGTVPRPPALGVLQVRRNISAAGANAIIAGKADVRIRVISYTISVSGTAEMVELYFGGYDASRVFDGGYFGANGGLHSDAGSDGNGPRGEVGQGLYANLAAGEDSKVCVIWTET